MQERWLKSYAIYIIEATEGETLSHAYKGAEISSNAGTGAQHEGLLILHPN